MDMSFGKKEFAARPPARPPAHTLSLSLSLSHTSRFRRLMVLHPGRLECQHMLEAHRMLVPLEIASDITVFRVHHVLSWWSLLIVSLHISIMFMPQQIHYAAYSFLLLSSCFSHVNPMFAIWSRVLLSFLTPD